jgi:hypothetical protein
LQQRGVVLCLHVVSEAAGVTRRVEFLGWQTVGILDRNLIFGLLSDMCHLLYEGLKCSEKAKLSVAFSNFRKLLQEEKPIRMAFCLGDF